MIAILDTDTCTCTNIKAIQCLDIYGFVTQFCPYLDLAKSLSGRCEHAVPHVVVEAKVFTKRGNQVLQYIARTDSQHHIVLRSAEFDRYTPQFLW